MLEAVTLSWQVLSWSEGSLSGWTVGGQFLGIKVPSIYWCFNCKHCFPGDIFVFLLVELCLWANLAVFILFYFILSVVVIGYSILLSVYWYNFVIIGRAIQLVHRCSYVIFAIARHRFCCSCKVWAGLFFFFLPWQDFGNLQQLQLT